MKPVKNTLPAVERIKSRKLLEELFSDGNSIKQYPIKLVWKTIPFVAGHPVQMAVAVPKRNMHDATDRNRMKRLIRETYRLNKQALVVMAETQKKGFALLFIATVKTPLSFAETQEKIILLLQRLILKNGQTAE